MNKILILCGACFLFSYSFVVAQDNLNIDSLEKEYKTTPSAVDDVLDVIRAYKYSASPSVKELALKLIPIAKSQKDTFAVLVLYNAVGNSLRVSGDLDSAMLLFRLASNLAQKGEYKQYAIAPLSNVGQILLDKGKLREVSLVYKEASGLLRYEKDTLSLLNYRMNLHADYGELYKQLGAYDSALLRFKKMSNIALQLQDEEVLASSYNTIGTIFSENLQKYDSAMSYYYKALDIYNKANYNLGVGLLKYNIADCYFNKGQYDSAYIWNKQSYEYLSDQDSLYLVYALSLDAAILQKKDIINKAIALYEISANVLKKKGATIREAQAYQKLGTAYNELEDFHQAKAFYLKALRSFEKSGFKDGISNTLLLLAENAVSGKKYKEATEYYARYSDTYSKYLNEESVVSANRAYILYQQPFKDLRISEQEARIEIETQKRKARTRLALFLAIGFIIVIVFSVTLYRSYVRIKKLKEHLEKLNRAIKEQKETILHINKRYIETLANSFRYEARSSNIPEDVVIGKNIHRIDSITEFLDFIYLDGAEATINFTEFLILFCKKKEKIFQCAIELEADSPLIISTNVAIQLTIIIDELIMNAIKYAFGGEFVGKLNIIIRKKKDLLEITVKDNGSGLPDNFSMTNQTRGLNMVYRFVVENLNGIIEAYNDNGATFHIRVKMDSHD